MEPTTLALLAFTAAGLASIVAVYMAKKSSTNYTLLVESAGAFDNMQKEIARLSGLANALSEENSALRKESITARSHSEEASKNLTKTIEQMRALEVAANQARDSLQRERAHFIQQLESAKSESERLQALAAKATHDDKLVAELAAAKTEAHQLRERLAKAQAQFSSINQNLLDSREEVQRLKRRNAQMERLYQTMRSLKVMAEERNANWEHALKDLSYWTLSQKGQLPVDGQGQLPIGELVGGALETIGKELVEVEIEA